MSQAILESIAENVIDGMVEDVQEAVEKAIEAEIPVKEILNDGLLGGMDEVAALFADGEMFVPEVLVAAKAMQAGMGLIRPLLLECGIEEKGTVLTATVEGDLHDIGVKLVGMMMEGAGFKVENMGVDINAQDIVSRVKELKPEILGMSAMLTTTMNNMKGVVDQLKEEGLYEDLKVMVGGAPVSPDFANKVGAHYSADATEAVALAKELIALKV